MTPAATDGKKSSTWKIIIVVGIIVFVVLPMGTCISCVACGSCIGAQNREQISTMRNDCLPPSAFRLKQGGAKSVPSHWRCVSPEEIASEEAVKVVKTVPPDAASPLAAAESTQAEATQAAEAESQAAQAKALALAPIKAALGDLAGQPADDAEAILASARRTKTALLSPPPDVPSELTDLQTKIADVVSGPLGADPPAEPTEVELEEPTFEEPEYTGAVKLAGSYRGPYSGGLFGGGRGIVVQKGKTFYVVRGVKAASVFTTSFNGYVTPRKTVLGLGPEQATVKLNIGRGGRDAKVYDFADRETYTDDKRAHRDAVKAAREQHKLNVKTIREMRKAQRKLRDEYRDQRRERDRLIREKRDQIKALPGAAEKALNTLEE